MTVDIASITEDVRRESAFVQQITAAIETVIVGQKYLLERILVALLTNGHILIEGVPGLAKTKIVKSLASLIDARFQRIQFTPDLLPADLIGTLIYNPREGAFATRKGPIFANIVLADEINRAPAKVHSALLEAMEERQVTIGDTSHPLEQLFLVLATQNPIDQEIVITYPAREEEQQIMRRAATADFAALPAARVHPDDILRIRAVVTSIHLDEKIEKYILDLVLATREPTRYGFADLARHIAYGASPRASINLMLASRGMAFLRGRAYVVPQDVKDIAPDVLRHRIIQSYEADVEGVTTDAIVQRLLTDTEVP